MNRTQHTIQSPKNVTFKFPTASSQTMRLSLELGTRTQGECRRRTSKLSVKMPVKRTALLTSLYRCIRRLVSVWRAKNAGGR
jgi:hypothetical protein